MLFFQFIYIYLFHFKCLPFIQSHVSIVINNDAKTLMKIISF